MRTQTTLFNLFSENKKEIKITGYSYSMDSDKLLLTVDDDLFTVISIIPDDGNNYYLAEQIEDEILNDFYHEELFELKICTKEELEQYFKMQKDRIKESEHQQYLRLKAKFEPN